MALVTNMRYAYQLLKRMKPNLIQIYNHEQILELLKGLASYCKAETTFTFYFTILPLSRAFLSINNREMKSESGFSFAMASQPLWEQIKILQWMRNRSLLNWLARNIESRSKLNSEWGFILIWMHDVFFANAIEWCRDHQYQSNPNLTHMMSLHQTHAA